MAASIARSASRVAAPDRSRCPKKSSVSASPMKKPASFMCFWKAAFAFALAQLISALAGAALTARAVAASVAIAAGGARRDTSLIVTSVW